jgi:hypothetical protein
VPRFDSRPEQRSCISSLASIPLQLICSILTCQPIHR